MSKITETLFKNGDIDKKLSSESIENYMRKNFSHCWKFFYENANTISIKLEESFFNDIETWHVWGVIATQKSFKHTYQKIGP